MRFLDGELSPKEERELLNRKHVVSQMEQQWNSTEGNILEYDRKQIFRRIQARTIMARRRRIVVWAAAVAASILILSTIGYRLSVSETSDEHRQTKTLAMETQSRERLQVILPDSTIVWLNAGSRIEYPEVFEQDVRQVTLSGEAYFDVAHKPKQPFFVKTDNLNIQVFGTKFTVSDYPNETSVEAALISGKISVDVINNGRKQSFELYPNEQLLHDRKSQATVVQKVDAQQLSEWINGRLNFDNAELGVIISKLGNWYGKNIECSGDLASRHHLTLTVRNESLEQIIKLMQSIAPISFEQTGSESYRVISTKSNK